MKKIQKNNNCTGCTACKNICPKQCISMIEDKYGFKYPDINEKECIDCNLCKKVCPIINKIQDSKNSYAYAIINKNDEVRKESSSGGFFSAIAEYVLEQKGIVFGAAYNDKYEVEHIGIENKNDIYMLRGAKYVQSNLEDTFQFIKKELLKKRMVLFSGTGCQVSGLKNYLQKEYNNLICIDLVCHGVPSPKIWKKYVENRAKIDNEGKFPKRINMRSKATGWSRYSYSIQFFYNEKKQYLQSSGKDSFMRAFISDLCSRPSCTKCQFKGINRNSDFTLGDYWGIWNQDLSMDDNKGTSLVYIHTNKGREMLGKIKDSIIIKEMNIDKSWEENPSVIFSSKLHPKSNLFYEKIEQGEEFENAVHCILDIKGKNKKMVKKLKVFFHKIKNV